MERNRKYILQSHSLQTCKNSHIMYQKVNIMLLYAILEITIFCTFGLLQTMTSWLQILYKVFLLYQL